MSLRYQKIWNLLENYHFEINLNDYLDLKCVLCGKLLVNAQQNTCGCRYCFKCIENEKGTRNCPGMTALCSETLIDVTNKDLHVDQFANKLISKIEVKCPVQYCKVREPLHKIEDHFVTHRQDCPFVDIGCDRFDVCIDGIQEHLTHGSYFHSKLLIGSLNDLKKEGSLLSENLRNTMEQFISSRCQIFESKIEEQNFKIKAIHEEKNKEIELLKSEVTACQAEIVRLNDRIGLMEKRSTRSGDLTDSITSLQIKVKKLEVKETNKSQSEGTLDKISKQMRTMKEKDEKQDKRLAKVEDCTDDVMKELRLVKDGLKKLANNECGTMELQKKGDDRSFYKVTDNVKALERRLDKHSDQCWRESDNVSNKLSSMEKEFDKVQSEFKKLLGEMNDVNVKVRSVEGVLKVKSDADLISNLNRIESKQAEIVGQVITLSQHLTELKAEWAQFKSVPSTNQPKFNAVSSPRTLPPHILWQVQYFSEKFERARLQIEPYVNSEWFDYTEYMVGLRLFPNGDDSARGTHLSLFLFIIKKRNVDPPPRRYRIVITICDQVDGSGTVSKEYEYCSFVKQEEVIYLSSNDNNYLGSSSFCELEKVLNNPRFIFRDCLEIRVFVSRLD